MNIQYILLICAILIPLFAIAYCSYGKKPIKFIIGLEISFYISQSLYNLYLNLDLYKLTDSNNIKLQAIELHRDIIFRYFIQSSIISFVYIIFIGILFWKISKKNSQTTMKEFLNSSLFYFILFIGSLIDILLGNIKIGYITWHSSVVSFIFIIPFLIKAILLKYSVPKKKKHTSKIIWILLVFVIVFYLYNIFISRM